MIVQPPLDEIPGESEVADARRINAMIEDVVRRAPEQYFWLHKRFKIKGEVDPYEAEATEA